MFVWFELPKYADAGLLNRATTMHIAIVNEEAFAVNRRDKMNGFRLSFTSATMEQIETGITLAKLGKLTYELCK